MKKGIDYWIFTGPESTGKSSLAREMARTTNLILVEEQARILLEQGLFSEIGETDLMAIAEYQWAAEILAEARSGLPLILDTDLLTIKIWYEWVFGKPCPDFWDQRLRSRTGQMYLLCHPDIAWAPDPLRSNPLDRDELYQKHIEVLTCLELPFCEIKGSGSSRISAVKDIFGIV